MKNLKNLKTKALGVTEALFRNITDKCGTPYFEHCKFVGQKAYEIAGDYRLSESVRDLIFISGVLHDVVEDIFESNRETGLDFIQREFGSDVMELVEILSKKKNEQYEDYIERVKKNDYALIIKAADSLHNSDFTRYELQDLNESVLTKSDLYRSRALGYIQELNERFNGNMI